MTKEATYKSVLMADYERYKVLPSIDALLDWRMSLMNKSEDKEFTKRVPKGFLEIEILATDYLLQKHNQ